MNHLATWLEATNISLRAQFILYSQSKHPYFATHPYPNIMVPWQPFPPLKVHKLTWVEMEKIELKGPYYNNDENYSPRHKGKKQKLFMDIYKDISDE
jgi:hypothetical protein